jgi:BirA family biotin operon repressor/biotin-[acetyl-CoA-carboxylase] ligase
MTAEQFPADVRHPATSLLVEAGRTFGRVGFAAVMLNELDLLYGDFIGNGFAPVREEWQRRCNAHGRELEVSDVGPEIVRGMFAGIDDSGALLVQGLDGTINRILSGDVRVL